MQNASSSPRLVIRQDLEQDAENLVVFVDRHTFNETNVLVQSLSVSKRCILERDTLPVLPHSTQLSNKCQAGAFSRYNTII